MNTEILQEKLTGDGASSCPIEGNEITFSLYILYIYNIFISNFLSSFYAMWFCFRIVVSFRIRKFTFETLLGTGLGFSFQPCWTLGQIYQKDSD